MQRKEVQGKRYCSNCNRENFPLKLCVCGGGASSGGSHDGNDKASGDEKKGVPTAAGRSDVHASNTNSPLDNAFAPQLKADEKSFNPDVIAALVAKKVLTIEDKFDLGILRVKVVSPSLLTESEKIEVQKFANTIENSLYDFVDQFKVPADKYSIKVKRDSMGQVQSLKIVFTNLELYQRFYQHSLKGLLPTQQKQANEPYADRKENSSFHPSPLSTKLERK